MASVIRTVTLEATWLSLVPSASHLGHLPLKLDTRKCLDQCTSLLWRDAIDVLVRLWVHHILMGCLRETLPLDIEMNWIWYRVLFSRLLDGHFAHLRLASLSVDITAEHSKDKIISFLSKGKWRCFTVSLNFLTLKYRSWGSRPHVLYPSLCYFLGSLWFALSQSSSLKCFVHLSFTLLRVTGSGGFSGQQPLSINDYKEGNKRDSALKSF